jgi:hypothetical protein
MPGETLWLKPELDHDRINAITVGKTTCEFFDSIIFRGGSKGMVLIIKEHLKYLQVIKFIVPIRRETYFCMIKRSLTLRIEGEEGLAS